MYSELPRASYAFEHFLKQNVEWGYRTKIKLKLWPKQLVIQTMDIDSSSKRLIWTPWTSVSGFDFNSSVWIKFTCKERALLEWRPRVNLMVRLLKSLQSRNKKLFIIRFYDKKCLIRRQKKILLKFVLSFIYYTENYCHSRDVSNKFSKRD